MRIAQRPRRCRSRLIFLRVAILTLLTGCATLRPQQYRFFTTPAPLPANTYLIIGFLGGREAWNAGNRPVRKMALKLRARNLPGVFVETVENTQRALALKLIRNALDRNQDGALDPEERAAARIVLYGHSFGGAAVVKLARQLKQMGVPVLLTLQVDSVGRNDQVIPDNVVRAANFYQHNGLLIRGRAAIRAENSQKTIILGNFRYDYEHKSVDRSGLPLIERFFAGAHTKMAADPEAWARVEELILQEIKP